MKSGIIAILTLMAAAFGASAQSAPAMKITAKADSTTLIQGDRTGVRVEVIKNGHQGYLLTMPQPETDYFGMEMSDCRIDSADLGNNRVQVRYDFTFQAFDPAEILTLPPFVYVVGSDTLKSDILTFKVLPVQLDPELGDPEDIENLTIHPDETTLSIQSKWYDIIPDWIGWAVAALALAAGAVVLWLLYKKNPKLFSRRKPLPPYEQAIRDFNKLKEQRLIESGRGKEFYTGVSDIWRTYLNGRFGISAMEMTSGQIIDELRKNPETHSAIGEIEDILRTSDFVKFAALAPTDDEMRKAYNTLYRFVENTRPLPEEEGGDKKNDKKETPQKGAGKSGNK